MAEHFLDAGAFTASTARVFDLKNSAVAGPAAYYDVRTVKITNRTSAVLSVIGPRGTFPVLPNGYAEQKFAGRVEELVITSDTTISGANKVILGLEGEILPIWEARP